MDDVTLIAAAACAALAILVYLMWRSATQSAWGELTQKEKRKWRVEEESRREGKAK
ncbi:Uncharacterised protein [uncultured archaeon]|nr:Uncharacterised protein [uncultured archaeon]